MRFILLLIALSFTTASFADESEWAKLPHTLTCNQWNKAGNVLSIDMPTYKVFSHEVPDIAAKIERCNFAKAQATVEGTLLMVNMQTGEVVPERGFYKPSCPYAH